MEEVKEIKTVRVDYKCEKCNNGYLVPNGTALLTNPTQYPHKCDNVECDNQLVFYRTYPYIDYRNE